MKKRAILMLSALFLGVMLCACSKTPAKKAHKKTDLEAPKLSLASGFYSQDTSVFAVHNYPKNTKIYYTTDGSQPTESAQVLPKTSSLRQLIRGAAHNASQQPTSPIYSKPQTEPFHGVCLRIAAFLPKKGFTKTTTATYFLGKNPYNCPVICISTDPKNLFDAQKGIYVLGNKYYQNPEIISKYQALPPWLYYRLPANYFERGKKWHKKAQFLCIEPNQTSFFCDEVKMSIKGNATRALPQKSLKISFDAPMHYPILGDTAHQNFADIVLRNGGSDQERAMMRDEFFQSLLINLPLYQQKFRAAVVFLNGEYWGVHYIREHINEENLALKYALKPNEIQLLEIANAKFVSKSSSALAFFEKLEAQCLSAKPNQNEFYKLVKDSFDVENIAAYFAIETYSANTDWVSNNVKAWKTTGKKWAFMVYDTDFGFGGNGEPQAYTINMYKKLAESPHFLGKFFMLLMQQKEFSELYKRTCQELYASNLSTKNLLQNLSVLQQNIAPLMPQQAARWNYPKNWQAELDTMRVFIQKRPFYAQQQLTVFDFTKPN